MFSSFPVVGNPFFIPRFLRPAATSIELTSVKILDVEANADKRARTLKHLLKLNHVEHSIIYHNLQFHNHLPHILGSAYILGGTSDHLQSIYERDSKSLEPWRDSPNEISDFDWRDYLGKPEFQRAYVDFFEDQLVLNGYDWKGVVNKYLFEGKEPLVNNLVAGLGHPLIHLGYAYELSSQSLAMEALGLSACFYNFMHKYIDNTTYTYRPPADSPAKPSTSTLETLHNIRQDPRFSQLPDTPGAISLGDLFKTHETAVLEHWNSWTFPSSSHNPDPKKAFEEAQATVVALLVGTAYPREEDKEYDFFLVHLLTTSHAIRILLPLIEGRWHVPLVRQWWLFVVAVYIAQGRPEINTDRFMKGCDERQDRDKGWALIDEEALRGKWKYDAHFVKALRAMKIAAQTWTGTEYFYCAARKMADEFTGWGGFGALGVEESGGGHEWEDRLG